MEILLPIFFGLHVLPLALAAWGAFKRNPWFHVPAGLVILSELAGFWLGGAVSLDGYVGGEGAWLLAGPVFAPATVLQAFAEAPPWVGPPVLAGIVTGALVWVGLGRRVRLRLQTYLAALAGVLACWVVAEITVEAAMRIGAAQIPGACDFRRSLAPDILAGGLSDLAVPTHGGIKDGNSDYLWSFRKNAWVERQRCTPEEPFACLCHEQAMRLLQSHQKVDSP